MNSTIKRTMIRTLQTLALPVIILVLFALITNGRTSTTRMMLITLQQSVIPILISMALVGNLMSGLLDFSSGAVVLAASIIGGCVMKSTNTGVLGLVLFCMLSAIALASLTGFLNNKLRLPGVVLTLGLLLVYEALPRIIFPAGATLPIGFSKLASIPWIFIVLAVVSIGFYVLNNFTTYGHNLRALGGNEEIARTAGLNISGIKQIGFTISGVFLGVAAVLYISSQGQILNIVSFGSMNIMFSALVGVILAMFLTRYCNLAVGVIVGTFTITMLTNGLVAAGLSQYMKDILSGIFLLILLIFSANQGEIKQWQIDRERVRSLTVKQAAYDGT
jgi:ribose transport system permease protein